MRNMSLLGHISTKIIVLVGIRQKRRRRRRKQVMYEQRARNGSINARNQSSKRD